MGEQAKRSSDEIKTLQRCINDLVSVLALPAIWTGGDPSQIGNTLSDALLGILELDLIYSCVTNSTDSPPVETLRFGRSIQSELRFQNVAALIKEIFSDDPHRWPAATSCLVAGRNMTLVPAKLGLRGEIGVVVAGCERPGFPRQTESLILSIAANQASIGFQEARLLMEQKRVAEELDRRVSERTAELAATNSELIKEIADRKKIEDRLRESESALQTAFEQIKGSEARLRQVIDTIPTIAWCNLPEGPNEFLNRGWREYTGMSPEESRGWAWQAAFHPDDLPALLREWDQCLAAGKAGEFEARIRRSDGVYRWFMIRAEPFRDRTGNIVRWYGTSTDIDDRKRVEEQFRRSEAFLAEGQNLAQIGNFSWLVETDDIKWSEQLYRIFDFDPSVTVTFELIGSRVHPEDLPLLHDMIAKAQRAVTDYEYEHRLLMANGSIKFLHLTAHASRDSHGRLEYIGAVQDVTRRRTSEIALAKAKSELSKVARITSMGVLTASIAHEINQPLSGIITNASTCLRMLSADSPNFEGAQETARRTIRDANRVSDVVTRLRALFARKPSVFEAIDLNDACKEVIALSSRELTKHRVVLQTEFHEDLPLISGDRVQLQQVILNLLRNGSEAMSEVENRPRLLSIKTGPASDDRVCLSVKDAGIGFDQIHAEKLFEAFYTTKDHGMGIGLSVSRSIIENHQGRLWATPNDGPGATFSFSIPCVRSGPAADAGAA